MAKTRTQQKAAQDKATAAAKRGSDMGAIRRSSVSKVPNKKAVQWTPRVSVKGSVSRDLNDYTKPKRTPGRPPNVKVGLRKNFHTFADLPQSPTSPNSTSPTSPEPVVTKASTAVRQVHTLKDFKPTKARRGTTGSYRTIRVIGDSETEVPTKPQVVNIPQPTRYAGQTPRSSLTEAVDSPKWAKATNKRRRASSPGSDQPRKRTHVTYDAVEQLNIGLVKEPQPIHAAAEVGALFAELKAQLHEFALKNFSFELEAPEDWPLHELAERYRPLMMTAQFIADGSQYGWQHFFATPHSRSALVYGVIGEYIRQHIFSVPSFGLSEDDAKSMDDIDFEYLRYDSFVRVKHRASLLRDILDHHDWKTASASAVEGLASQLLDVLTPLLPNEVFSYDPTTRQFQLSKSMEANDARQHLQNALEALLTKASALSWSLILTGRNGTVFNLAQHIQKGEKWYGDQQAPQNCINKDMVYRTQAHGFSASKEIRDDALSFPNGVADTDGDNDTKPYRPRIRMTCFPRVEMYVPHGPDMEELGKLQEELTKNGVSADELPGVLPDGTEIYPLVPDEVRYTYDHSKHGPWNEEENGPMRMSYVSMCQHISTHDVYLENNYVEESEKDFIAKYRLKHTEPAKPTKQQGKRGASGSPPPSPPGDDSDNGEDELMDDSSSSSESDSELTSTTSSKSSNHKRRFVYTPGHSDDNARALYDYTRRQRQRNILDVDARLGWRYGKPLPESERVSLALAVSQARIHRATQSPFGSVGRLGLAAHDKFLKTWNRLIAPHGTSLENYTLLLAIVICICWHKGWDVPHWTIEKLSQLRGISVSDIRQQLATAKDIIASMPGDVSARFFHSVELIKSLEWTDSLPLSLQRGARKVVKTFPKVDREGMANLPKATRISEPFKSAVTGPVASATDYMKTVWGTAVKKPREMLSELSRGMNLNSAEEAAQTTATVVSTSVVTSTSVATKTTSTTPLGGVVPHATRASTSGAAAGSVASAAASAAAEKVVKKAAGMFADWNWLGVHY
ncbi:uncharacterized protein AB675_10509 [Cyphellophora attinorum]|uniref:Uncharacterized protein n=1 Tax=Cyphellophora attinorum TaxID=1664694 RepID=A0A0N1GYP9_9EURO|nr:uncharacterized protein AB675_10509 [Phialophora attinorum]KPI35884.1 hypothetical protein AB675_10509 [Phialophora attinorum]